MISSAAVQINHCWTVLGRIEMPNSIEVPAWRSLRSNIWDVKLILLSPMVFFFSLKDFSQPKSIHFCHSVYANGFLKLDYNSSFLLPQWWRNGHSCEWSPHQYRFFGIKECTDEGWGYRGGKKISFRWLIEEVLSA